jgi:hypothetical protein
MTTRTAAAVSVPLVLVLSGCGSDGTTPQDEPTGQETTQEGGGY